MEGARNPAGDESTVALEDGLGLLLVAAIKRDDPSELEKILKQESAKLSRGKTWRAVADKLLHLASAWNAAGCVHLLLTAVSSFPVARIDAVIHGAGEEISALRRAARHHAAKAMEILLRHNTEAALLPLEEALLSYKLELDEVDVIATPAAELVEVVRSKDLAAIRMLVPLCGKRLSSVACKLVRDLKVVPLVALLLNADRVMNAVSKSGVEVPGTVVDLLLTYLLPPTPFAKIKDRSPAAATESSAAKAKFTKAKRPAATSFYRQHNAVRENQASVAAKLLECVLLFRPKLAAHSQSSFAAPLIRACQGNDLTLVRLLLDSGAPVNERDADGNTPLNWVMLQATPSNGRRVNIDIVESLLEGGAEAIGGNRLGVTPVHTAAGHGHYAALRMMLTKDIAGVNVLAGTSKETPLHYASFNNRITCAALLLEFGANRNVCNFRNMKPCNLAPTRDMYALLSLDQLHVALFNRECWTGKDRSSGEHFSRLTSEFTPVQGIGAGGFGAVVECINNVDGQRYAIKLTSWSVSHVEEIKILATVNHPNIIRFYSAWVEDKLQLPRELPWVSSVESLPSCTVTENAMLAIQTELCSSTLASYIEARSAVDADRSCVIFEQLLDGVLYLHGEGINHGDLAPTNVFLTNGTVKLGDFGLAHDNDFFLDFGYGQPLYKDPNPKSARERNRFQRDVYSLGLILFELFYSPDTRSEYYELLGRLRSGLPLPAKFASFELNLARWMIGPDKPPIHSIWKTWRGKNKDRRSL